MLDLDHGNPSIRNILSSNRWWCFHGRWCGSQLLEKYLRRSKAYATRVGAGPFPQSFLTKLITFVNLVMSSVIVTGRPRRCGWLDLMVVKYAAGLNSLDYP